MRADRLTVKVQEALQEAQNLAGKLNQQEIAPEHMLRELLAQDEASSVVWGMPGAVARAGLAALLAPPEALAKCIAALAAERADA